MNQFTTPQDAPWKLHAELEYTGDHVSGFYPDHDTSKEAIMSHKKGVHYTVMDVRPSTGSYKRDDEIILCHGYSILQSDLDPDGFHRKAIDVTSMEDYKIL